MLTVEYDGTRFHGWQTQLGVRTVQGVFEEALARLTGDAIRVVSASRTDAGVHALGQVVNFRTESAHSPGVFQKALNAILPKDIAVLSAEEVEAKFNARFWAKGKIYRYLIYNNYHRRALGANYYWHIPEGLEAEPMQKSAQYLIGKYDFSSFQGAGEGKEKDPVREMKRIEIKKNEDGYISVELEASGFLKHMARNIIGTLVMAGRGKIPPEAMAEILKAKNRKLAGPTAPAQGLYLVKVLY